MNWEALFESTYRENQDVILSMLEQNNNGKILDCGCGNGDFTKKLAEKVGTSKTYGIELFEKEAQEASKKGINVYQADLNERFPIPEDDSFDFICANQIIEHLQNTDLFIEEIYRVLRPGGVRSYFDT